MVFRALALFALAIYAGSYGSLGLYTFGLYLKSGHVLAGRFSARDAHVLQNPWRFWARIAFGLAFSLLCLTIAILAAWRFTAILCH